MGVTYDNFGEFMVVTERITDGIEDWLKDEQVSSSVPGSTNSYLDDFDRYQIQRRLSLPIDDPGNWYARKNEDHLDVRLLNWWRDFADEPENDTLSAKLTFTPLMLLSGTFRTQCVIQATSAEDYGHRRFGQNRVTGIDMWPLVANKLDQRLVTIANFADANITLESLEAQKSLTQVKARATHRFAIERCGMGLDIGQEESPAVVALLESQATLADLVIDSVIFAAKIRGGELARVPFWEAKSVSEDPQVYYPFSEIN